MSHSKERSEKICLNCNAQLSGPFCHICGQENIEPEETAWHLVTHIFNDITHFDGKFFNTVGLLIRKPGYLSREYVLGRRASYLNPVRMYIFTSALFFFIFFSFFHIPAESHDSVLKIEGKTLEEIRALQPDSLKIFTAKINNGQPVAPEALEEYLDSIRNREGLIIVDGKYRSKAAYDSVLKSGSRKDNWLQRKLIYKEIEANEKYRHNQSQLFATLSSTFLHSFPQMLFISLPFIALFLKVLYRRRKDYYYVGHGIFSMHFYIFVFITLLVIFGLGEMKDWLHWEWLNIFQRLLDVAIFFYLYKSMRNFYQQSRKKTVAKFALLNIFAVILMAFLCIVFIGFSFMKI